MRLEPLRETGACRVVLHCSVRELLALNWGDVHHLILLLRVVHDDATVKVVEGWTFEVRLVVAFLLAESSTVCRNALDLVDAVSVALV